MSRNQRAILRNRKIGFVFQNYNLLPKTTSVENVELPLMYNPAISAKERFDRSVKALQRVGLGDRLYHKKQPNVGRTNAKGCHCQSIGKQSFGFTCR